MRYCISLRQVGDVFILVMSVAGLSCWVIHICSCLKCSSVDEVRIVSFKSLRLLECTVSVLAEFVDILIVVLIKKMFKLPVSIYVWSTEVLWDNVYVYNNHGYMINGSRKLHCYRCIYYTTIVVEVFFIGVV